MLPLTILAAQKLSGLLTYGDALQQQLIDLAAACNVNVPAITSAQVVLSSASADTASSISTAFIQGNPFLFAGSVRPRRAAPPACP